MLINSDKRKIKLKKQHNKPPIEMTKILGLYAFLF